MVQPKIFLLAAFIVSVYGAAVPREAIEAREIIAREIPGIDAAALSEVDPRALNDYAPKQVSCPTFPLLRPATGLSSQEQAYIARRKIIADGALKKWLAKTNSGFGTNGTMPTIALTTSGGGYRSLLIGAGVVQALDERDSSGSTSGLYQALTYHAGLSGGSWLVSALAANDYPTISSIRDNPWVKTFIFSPFNPSGPITAIPSITTDLLAKWWAGFSNCLNDLWGRLLSYKFINVDGAASQTFSSVTKLSNFTNFNVPFPVITALGTKVWEGDCGPGPNGTTYEFTPYEFGSWDSDVSAFTPTAYLGTTYENGQPATSTCIQNYDNIGYVFGTSSSLASYGCAMTKVVTPASEAITLGIPVVDQILAAVHAINKRDGFSIYPNPFYKYTSSSSTPNSHNEVSRSKDLYLVDGGLALQNNPIFPFLQPARNIDVILVNDNSDDGYTGYPNGTEILTTYVQSFNQAGLSERMPSIPTVETFISQGLHQRATFFGCNEPSKTMIVFLPNKAYSYQSGTSTMRMQYDPMDTKAMIANGNLVATQGDDAQWGTCLGCAIMKKSGQAMPAECGACFDKYCYTGPAAPISG